jgi:hypothetical protein
MNRLIHRTWGEGFMATIYETQRGKTLWIAMFCVCQILFLGVTVYFGPGQEFYRTHGRSRTLNRPFAKRRSVHGAMCPSYGGSNYCLRGFIFVVLGSEDFGREKMAPAAILNSSNGVLSVVMDGTISLSCLGVYNDPRPTAFRGDGLRAPELEAE